MSAQQADGTAAFSADVTGEWVVHHLRSGRWAPISRWYPTREQAALYVETLPTDWNIEIRNLATPR